METLTDLHCWVCNAPMLDTGHQPKELVCSADPSHQSTGLPRPDVRYCAVKIAGVLYWLKDRQADKYLATGTQDEMASLADMLNQQAKIMHLAHEVLQAIKIVFDLEFGGHYDAESHELALIEAYRLCQRYETERAESGLYDSVTSSEGGIGKTPTS